ncbi:hypothetical protein BG74_09610 [Sodalis-like endosymbiont of Proechinophthirus fluctus]|uniref:hypothetical protein n=1 Tax=Sodalis-like endosymbiont of Proechinophthirus fluctus TaxID=1462730 RepID=UPI0007A7FB6F|nr:hypothetical protein [Sodalis-like endosymbiont of Proechinophthirus fluctus]KYP95357.1 hypothetical protein BG74_09610 [Sodalis-like endosymbiont of Proechinophthirus fluctus]
MINSGQVTSIETSKQNEMGVKADYGRVAGSCWRHLKQKAGGSLSLSGICNGDAQYEYGNYAEEHNRCIELNLFGEPVVDVRLNGMAQHYQSFRAEW